MNLVGIVIGVIALATGVACYFIARGRVPRTFRSPKSALAVSLPCLRSRHAGCHQHLSCPCACHDDVLHFALLTDPQYIPNEF